MFAKILNWFSLALLVANLTIVAILLTGWW